MKDTMQGFMDLLDKDVSNYKTKINLVDNADNEEAKALAQSVQGDWMAAAGISYEGETVTLEIYQTKHDKVRFVDRNNDPVTLSDEGAYLCLRLADTAQIGDTITFSPYGSDKTYSVKVAGYLRSVMTEAYAEKVGVTYHISSVYTDEAMEQIKDSALISGTQDKAAIMESYDSFMDIMNLMVLLFILAVGFMVARKNRQIDMVEALKNAE